ncbi:unnamed protein product [Schistosoma bovis]|nr:unnamed protein product [Schistosoma bovis]CAH8539041.1 unnamed protein product [Schistosoma bovis]
MKQGQTKEKRGTIHKSSQHNSKKEKGQNTKKAKFHELIARQKQIKDKKAIEKKREERLHKRKERNISMQKLTRKGQPVMKHRIKLLLKQLCPGDA